MRRGSLFVDPVVQGRLAWKVIAYWFFCLLALELFVACWMLWVYRVDSAVDLARLVMHVCAIPFAASLLLLPVVVIDSLRFSHRFTGPMVRFRRAIKELADGENVEPLAIRDGDFWNDYAADFNRLAVRIQELEQALANAPADQQEPWTV
jgi:hypothetical protein